jgi:hypothetical protein
MTTWFICCFKLDSYAFYPYRDIAAGKEYSIFTHCYDVS